jgi:hypothetical protein
MARESHLIFCEIESIWLPFIKWLRLYRHIRVFLQSCDLLFPTMQFYYCRLIGSPFRERVYSYQAFVIADISSIRSGEAIFHLNILMIIS